MLRYSSNESLRCLLLTLRWMVGADGCSSTKLVSGTSSVTSATECTASVWTCSATDGRWCGLTLSIENSPMRHQYFSFGSLLLASSARGNPSLSFLATLFYLKSVFTHFWMVLKVQHMVFVHNLDRLSAAKEICILFYHNWLGLCRQLWIVLLFSLIEDAFRLHNSSQVER